MESNLHTTDLGYLCTGPNKYVLTQKGLKHLFLAFTLLGLFFRDAISH